MKAEVCVHPDDESPLWINGRPLLVGQGLDGQFGLHGRVGQRLLRYLVYLALRRDAGLSNGWVRAEELALLVDDGGSVGAARQFLKRHVESYFVSLSTEQTLSDDSLPERHLIQYEPQRLGSTGYRRGRTVGRYRFGPVGPRLSIRRGRAMSWLTEVPNWKAGKPAMTPSQVLAMGDAELFGGSLVAVREIVGRSLECMLNGQFLEQGEDAVYVLASLWERLSNIDMELGQARASLRAARRAEAIFGRLNHVPGMAHALELQAHALGQLGEPEADLAAVRTMRRLYGSLLDRSRRTRKGARRGYYLGVFGHRLSKIGDYAGAARRLDRAVRLNEEAGEGPWTLIWRLRRAENHLGAGRFADAARFFERLAGARRGLDLTIPQQAAIARVRAHFHAAVGEVDAAVRWTEAAMLFGIDYRMENQVRLLMPLIDEFGLDFDEIKSSGSFE